MRFLSFIKPLACSLILIMSGSAYEYLWPTLTWWNNYSMPIFVAFSALGVCLFTRNFLVTRVNSPLMDKILLVLALLCLLPPLGAFIRVSSRVGRELKEFAVRRVAAMACGSGCIRPEPLVVCQGCFVSVGEQSSFLARREEGAYRAYVTDEQHCQGRRGPATDMKHP